MQNLQRAASFLEQNQSVKLLKKSSLYETAPWGDSDQDAFLNQAWIIETSLSPFQILHLIKDIEVQVGRVNTRRWGPRVIDIDILFYGDLILNTETLTIPHAEIQNRSFALIPTSEIAPKWKDPRNKKTVEELQKICPDTLKVSKIEVSENAV